MKGQINDGGPAFPFEEWVKEDGSQKMIMHQGMSLRARIALEVLPSLLRQTPEDGTQMFGHPKDAACLSLAYADALLKELDA